MRLYKRELNSDNLYSYDLWDVVGGVFETKKNKYYYKKTGEVFKKFTYKLNNYYNKYYL